MFRQFKKIKVVIIKLIIKGRLILLITSFSKIFENNIVNLYLVLNKIFNDSQNGFVERKCINDQTMIYKRNWNFALLKLIIMSFTVFILMF